MRQSEPCRSLKKRLLTCALVTVCGTAVLATGPALAQELEVPQPSPVARVEQRVGISDFSVDYSSPAVRNRKIWGELVPLGKPWRTGANAVTKLTAENDFTFGGKKVPAGAYALYTIPGKDSWSVVLNSGADAWGAPGPDPKKDVAKVTVKPQSLPNARERLTFIFSDTTDDSTNLDLEWEKVRVSVPLKVDTRSLVLANIDKNLQDSWRPHFTAARWLLDSGGDLKSALTHIDTSISIKPTWWNNWVRAQILAKQGKNRDAVDAASKAQQLGKGDRVYESFFKPQVEKAVAEWKQKA